MTVDVVAGRFALCDPIGAGGSGTVWRAYDVKRQRYCAAKLLRQRDAGDLLRFVREQSVRLDHPHIVSPYSWVAEDGTVLIASALMAGGSVHTLIGDFGAFAEGTVVAVLRQVLSGLQAVHDAELIHRDVKPANLLLRATGTGPLHVVLTDFGLTISRLDARLTQVGMVIGTPGYVPPEVLRGGVPPDPRHDLFAAGRLALTMLAGEEPTGRVRELISAIHDPVLRRTVDALLRSDPDERPLAADAAAGMLDGAPADETPRTRDGDPIEVLDQLPELPSGWGPGGPVESPAAPARVAPRATIVDVQPTAPTGVADHPATVARPLALSFPGPGSALQPPPTAADGGPPATGVAAELPTPSGRRPGRIWLAVVIAATAVAAVVLGLWLLPDTSTNDPSDPPASPSVTSPGTASSGLPTSPPATSQASGSVVSTTVATVETVAAGDSCTWQQEGDRRPAEDGAILVCTLADGAYRWSPPG